MPNVERRTPPIGERGLELYVNVCGNSLCGQAICLFSRNEITFADFKDRDNHSANRYADLNGVRFLSFEMICNLTRREIAEVLNTGHYTDEDGDIIEVCSRYMLDDIHNLLAENLARQSGDRNPENPDLHVPSESSPPTSPNGFAISDTPAGTARPGGAGGGGGGLRRDYAVVNPSYAPQFSYTTTDLIGLDDEQAQINSNNISEVIDRASRILSRQELSSAERTRDFSFSFMIVGEGNNREIVISSIRPNVREVGRFISRIGEKISKYIREGGSIPTDMGVIAGNTGRSGVLELYDDNNGGIPLGLIKIEGDTVTFPRTPDPVPLRPMNEVLGSFATLVRETDSSDIEYRPLKKAVELLKEVEHGEVMKSTRAFGCELEIQVKNNRGHDLSCELPRIVGITRDGSINGYGFEIQTPPAAGNKGEMLINKVTDILSSYEAKTDRSCGYHVHIDFKDSVKRERQGDIYDYRHNMIKNLWLFYIAFEDVLASFMPRSRRNNRYCTQLKTDYHAKEIATTNNLEELEKIWYRVRGSSDLKSRKADRKDETRYRGINLHTLFIENHLEIRFHSGTINPRKILEWANLHCQIADLAVEMKLDSSVFNEQAVNVDLEQKTDIFFQILDLPEASEAYFRVRQEKFKNVREPRKVIPARVVDVAKELFVNEAETA